MGETYIQLDKKQRPPEKKIHIYVDKDTGKPKGDATLTYDDPEAAKAAINWFNGTEFMGNKITVQIAQRKVKNFPQRGGGRGRGRGRSFDDHEERGGGGRGGGRGSFGDSRGEDWMCPDPRYETCCSLILAPPPKRSTFLLAFNPF